MSGEDRGQGIRGAAKLSQRAAELEHKSPFGALRQISSAAGAQFHSAVSSDFHSDFIRFSLRFDVISSDLSFALRDFHFAGRAIMARSGHYFEYSKQPTPFGEANRLMAIMRFIDIGTNYAIVWTREGLASTPQTKSLSMRCSIFRRPMIRAGSGWELALASVKTPWAERKPDGVLIYGAFSSTLFSVGSSSISALF